MDVPTVAPATSGPAKGCHKLTRCCCCATGAGDLFWFVQWRAGPHQAGRNRRLHPQSQSSTTLDHPGSSASPQLAISYKYVSELQLVVTVFTNAQTGEEVAQFPPQELIGLAEFFDQIDGVTLDRKV